MISLARDSSQLAETYDRVGERQFHHGKQLIAALRVGAGQHVLDVGCGTGLLSAHVARLVGPAGKVDALDPLPLRVALCKKKAPTNLEVRVGVAEDLSAYPDHSFDVVYLNSVFHWLPEKTQPLKEAFRVLEPGGRIGISTAATEAPHDFELLLREVFRKSDLVSDGREVPSATSHRVSSIELFQLLERAGFTDVQVELKSFVDHFEDTQDVFAFNNASSFGNFLSSLSHEERALTHALLEDQLERRRTQQGIRLERQLAFAIAQRPGRA